MAEHIDWPGSQAEPESLGFCPERLARLDAALRADVEAQTLPGGVYSIFRHGRLVRALAFGRRDPAADDPMAMDAVFRIYSMSKPIVSVAALMLVEQGRLLLSQPLADWLPEWAHARVGQVGSGGGLELQAAEAPIRLLDLLRHTAGLSHDFCGSDAVHRQYAAARLFNRQRDNAEFSKALAELPLWQQPGRAWSYSHATDVLGRVIELASGQSLGEFLRLNVFEPLGMRDTGFVVPQAEQHRLAEPFARDPDTRSAVRVFDVRQPVAHEMGGAGLVSTAADHARFMQMLLSGGRLGELRLLSPRTVERMRSDHLNGLPVTGSLLAPGHGFGLGVAVRLATGGAAGAGSAGMYYWGGLAGTSFFIDPAEGLHAQLLIQQPGRRDHYREVFKEMVYAALVD